MKNKKLILGALIIVMTVTTLSGCGVVDKIKGNKGTSEVGLSNPKEKTSRPTNLGEYQELMNQRASRMIAEEQGINLSPESIDAFITNTVGEVPPEPSQKFDLNNHPAVIKKVIGEEGYRNSFIPPYVENQLKDKLSEQAQNISEEDLNIALIDYKDYLDSLGIQEESRKDYIQHILVAEEVSMQIESIYYDAYSKTAVQLLEMLEPEYLQTLNLE